MNKLLLAQNNYIQSITWNKGMLKLFYIVKIKTKISFTLLKLWYKILYVIK